MPKLKSVRKLGTGLNRYLDSILAYVRATERKRARIPKTLDIYLRLLVLGYTDKQVAKLYGLTEEEHKYVKEQLKPTIAKALGENYE